MCRILAYSGPILPLRRLISDPPHSLVAQSYSPREMSSGVVNADGFGFAWYDEAEEAEPPDRSGAADTAPYLYRHILPIWSDPNLASLGRYVRSGLILGYIRSATPGQALDMSNTQPFVHGRHSFVHNGFMSGFRKPEGRGLHRALRAALDDDFYAAIHGATDSEHLFAWLLQHVRAAGDLAAGVDAALTALVPLTDGLAVTLNFALSDGRRTVAVRHALGTEPPSLYLLTGHAAFPGATVVASEPLFDDPAWTACPPATLLTLDADDRARATVRPLAA